MEYRLLSLFVVVACAAGIVGCKDVVETRPASASVASAPVKAVADRAQNDCLSCHGPFDKLIADSSKYVAPSGEKTSPHRYVPHDSKLAKDIPECTQCHTAHSLTSLPEKGSIDLSKVMVDSCYKCHHEKNFKSCKECHS
jgi:hypothetical protein